MEIFEYISKYVTSTVVEVNGKKKMMENRKLDGKRFDLGDMIKLF